MKIYATSDADVATLSYTFLNNSAYIPIKFANLATHIVRVIINTCNFGVGYAR